MLGKIRKYRGILKDGPTLGYRTEYEALRRDTRKYEKRTREYYKMFRNTQNMWEYGEIQVTISRQ